MHIRLFALLLACCPFVLFAQTDTASLLLIPEQLADTNIQTRSAGLLKRQAVSATRSLEDVEDLPFSVWVVTARDIQRNGFVTLGDVLRAAPGIRVSQPGNALEGETFLVRGLPGNQHMKVLINDVPVRPAIAPGMPIGAQLPIQQVERIEVLYGPAAAIYGDGACAGVVNIILKESERPIYTQADLSLGNFGFNTLNLMLGGKLFRDKNIFRFSVYGSSTVRDNTDYYYDERLFMPQNYLPFGLDSTTYLLHPNYRARMPDDSIARTAPIPHESRLLGINLTWRGLHFNYNRMTRFEHSSLGLSPLAVSYANPSNRVAEQIETFALSFQKKRAKRTATNTFSLIRYQVQNSSSFTPIFDRLSGALYTAEAPQSELERQAALNNITREFTLDERYFAANGTDLRYESRIAAALRPRLFLDAGLQVNLGAGVPLMGYFRGPVEVSMFGQTDPPVPRPFDVGSIGYADANTFGQLHWRGKKTTLIVGTAVNVSLDNPLALAPRLALKQRIDSTRTLRLTYSEGFQRPLPFRLAQSYRITGQDTSLTVRSLIQEVERSGIGNTTWLNQTERVRLAEIALMSRDEWIASEFIVFYQEAHRLARNGYLVQTEDEWTYGYRHAPGTAMRIWGAQALFGRNLLSVDLPREALPDGQLGVKGELFFQYSRGQEWFGFDQPSIHDVRNYPRRLTQFRVLLYSKKWEFMVFYNRQVTIKSSAGLYRAQYQREIADTTHPKFSTWDAVLRIYLSNNFLVYASVRNAFNRHHAGIDATGTPDDLLYNPQQGRLIRVGVHYDMN